MIRRATFEDIPELLLMGQHMHAESPRFSKLAFSVKKVAKLAKFLIDSPRGILLISEHGMFWGSVAPAFFSEELCAEDYVLYVEPEYRGNMEAVRLLKGYIAEARKLGAKDIGISNSTLVDKDRVAEFFRRIGFQEVGTSFTMEG
jgi:N-acetylglutamate synthase-like GNAT family acetyltransferase